MILIFSLFLCEATLVYFTEVCRHGARAPIAYMPWDSDLRWPNGAKNLVNEGLRQHYLLGLYLRKQYITDTKFLSDVYNSTDLKIYSTSISRTIFSMESQLMGLYPQEDIYFDQILLPSGLTKTSSVGKSPLIPIHLNENKIEPMLLIEDYCKPYNDDVKLRKSSQEFSKIYQRYPDVIEVVEKYFNITKDQPGPDFLRVLGSVTSNSFMGYPVPAVFDQDWLEKAQNLYIDIRKFLRYGTEYSRKLAASEFLNTVIEQFESKIEGKGHLKATLYSAHDTTLMNIFSTLNLPITIQPPFASILIFELHEIQDEFFIKILYNSSPVTLPCCRSSLCEYSKFKSFISSSTFKNVTDACLNFPKSLKKSVETFLPGAPVEMFEVVAEQSEEESSASLLIISLFSLTVLIVLYKLIKKIPR